jgi:AcrR family transcriptional regulator
MSMQTRQMPLREEQKALTRARIVDAAKLVFEEQGYGAASIGSITAEAGINRATFYLHFSDKFAVFREVVAHDRLHTDEYWRELNVALKERTPEAIAGWIRRLTVWAKDNARLMPAKHEAMASEPAFAKDFQPRYDRLATEIDDYLNTYPEADREAEKIRVQMLVVLADQMLFHALVQEVWEGSIDQLLDVLTDIFCRSLNIRS